MVHILVLNAFVITILSILFVYGYFAYSVLIFVTFLPLILVKFLNNKNISVIIFVTILFFIVINSHIQKTIYKQENLRSESFIYTDKTNINSSGRIAEFPGYRFSNNQYIVELDDSPARILTFTEQFQKFSYLERIQFNGQLMDVRTQDKEWQKYYQKLDVHYIVFRPNISTHDEIIAYNSFEKIKLKLFNFKLLIRSLVTERFSSQASTLVLGMLLGEKDELSKDEKDLFNQVGLSHILVVSGYNISLLITFIFLVFKFLNKYARIVLSLVLIFMFVLLVGGEGSVVRAALMGSIIVFAKISNRPSSAINVLIVAVIIMLLYDPFSIFDASLHLSFIATFSLLILPKTKKIPEFILTSMWVFLFVTPYIMYLSDFASLAGIVSNILVVLLLPFFMIASLVTFISFLIQIPFWIDVFVIETMSRYIFWVANITKHIPRIETSTSVHLIMIIYLIIFCGVLFLKNRYSTAEFIEKHYQKFVPQNPN